MVFLIAGDFNRLDVNRLLRHFHLKQNDTALPSKDATLDLVLTNVHEFYTSPLAFPPFGLSDHSTVVASPTSEKDNPTPVPREYLPLKRDQRPSCKAAMKRYRNSIDWPLLLASLGSCEDKWAVFRQDILTRINI